VTLIGVKSKYGSCSGNCTGLIKVNKNQKKKKKNKKDKKRKVPFVGMMGWAVNSIVNAVEGSIPFLPNRINEWKKHFFFFFLPL
jgi:hypothetical protein